MGSKRKTAPAEPAEATTSAQDRRTNSEEATRSPTMSPEQTKDQPGTTETQASAKPSRSSWYGSWRSKASPVAQIAKESISVAKGATSEALSEAAPRRPNSVSKSSRGSRKSVPLAAEATHVHATYGSAKPRSAPEEKSKSLDGTTESKEEPKVTEGEENQATTEDSGPTDGSKSTRPQSGGWFGWWSRPDGYGSDSEQSNKRQKLDTDESSDNGTSHVPPENSTDTTMQNAMQFEGIGPGAPEHVSSQPEMVQAAASSRSWFGLWSSAQNQQPRKEGVSNPEVTSDETAVPPASKNIPDEQRAGLKDESLKPRVQPDAKSDSEDRSKSSGWAFWSSDKAKDSADSRGGTQKQVGELAVAGTPSQSHPEAAQFNEQNAEQKQLAKASLLKRVQGKASSSSSPTMTPPEPASPAPPAVTAAIEPPEDMDLPKPVVRGKLAQTRPNLTRPVFRDTFPVAPNPGYMDRLTTYLAQSLHFPGSQQHPGPRHVYRASSPRPVKRAIALGIHGFFPMPLITKVLGQPTGTSIRFANYAAASIKKWCREHQPHVKEVEVEKVALEGEGYIADRVSTLWKLLLNWLNQLRHADFIFVACHSQGVPVAMMLLAKLIQLGCLDPHVRIGVCAMAGINLGPFAEYRSRLFGGSALELFEFCDPGSIVSKSYAEALETCLRSGVRVTFVGSIDDQLVSLESSLHIPLSHPYVCRAIFIDGRLHAPNFLTHLVAFALKLRNLGISDHGLIRELSGPLAGSLVGSDGHSRVYDDPSVYKQAIEFALESTDAQPLRPQPETSASSQPDREKAREAAAARRASLGGPPASPALANSIRRGSFSASSGGLHGIAPVFAAYEVSASAGNANPFYLPWAVRGMLEEEVVKREMADEVQMLVKEFEEWRPSSKVLKDVRWRLEGVKNIL